MQYEARLAVPNFVWLIGCIFMLGFVLTFSILLLMVQLPTDSLSQGNLLFAFLAVILLAVAGAGRLILLSGQKFALMSALWLILFNLVLGLVFAPIEHFWLQLLLLSLLLVAGIVSFIVTIPAVVLTASQDLASERVCLSYAFKYLGATFALVLLSSVLAKSQVLQPLDPLHYKVIYTGLTLILAAFMFLFSQSQSVDKSTNWLQQNNLPWVKMSPWYLAILISAAWQGALVKYLSSSSEVAFLNEVTHELLSYLALYSVGSLIGLFAAAIGLNWLKAKVLIQFALLATVVLCALHWSQVDLNKHISLLGLILTSSCLVPVFFAQALANANKHSNQFIYVAMGLSIALVVGITLGFNLVANN
ncbi:hypothetical protein ACMZOO_05110 [Catenovulum sp. SX2]|uniref:hypothetical protein n=1 Tax=Catenovulum sp. SX2 TaxID=3398614 RepID=UPI003F864126